MAVGIALLSQATNTIASYDILIIPYSFIILPHSCLHLSCIPVQFILAWPSLELQLKRFLGNGHIRYCGLVRGSREEKNNNSFNSLIHHSFMYSFIHSLTNSDFCLTTRPQALLQWVLHREWSSISSFNYQYLVFSLISPTSCLRLLLHLYRKLFNNRWWATVWIPMRHTFSNKSAISSETVMVPF